MPDYGFTQQLGIGAMGVQLIVDYFRLKRNNRQWDIVDVQADKEWQRRDIDLLINGRMTEIKTDTHKSGNLFVELSVGDRPGCVFVSRAEYWFYLYPLRREFYLVELPRLQHWAYRHAHEYALKRVRSRQGGRVWYAEGVAVPLPLLEVDGIVHRFSLEDGYVAPDKAKEETVA